jgi:uncharacterized membrane protein
MIFTIALVCATLLTALVTGLLFGFALIVMPGIRKLGDREFVRAFQVMDGIIQNNHPLFVLVWGGSALLLLISAVLGFRALSPALWTALIAATAGYFIGVQVPTMVVNVPLNNALQTANTVSADDEAMGNARRAFESRWNRWNRSRALTGAGVTTVLLVVLTLIS